MNARKPALKILLCAPRGFCAGVVRAIDAVERALEKYGAPVYVRHEIVHNKYVVEGLRKKGAIFVEELDEVPATDRPVIFSAHGVPKAVPEDAERRASVRHRRHLPAGDQGASRGHDPFQARARDRARRPCRPSGSDRHHGPTARKAPSRWSRPRPTRARSRRAIRSKLAYVTQTTLSLDDTAEIVGILKERFPAIVGPHKEDICYATTNRQEAVKRVAPRVDAMIVVGAPNSSNSQRLREVAERAGCRVAALVQRADDIDWSVFGSIKSLGLTAGASAPEVLVEEIIDAFGARYEVAVESVSAADEDVFFPLPRELRENAAE